MKSIDEELIIDEIIIALDKKERDNLLQFCSDKFGIENYSQFNGIITRLLDKGLISPVDNSLLNKNFHKLTSQGRKVIELGGWIKFIEQAKIKESEETFKIQKETEKLNYETKLAKWQVKTFWPLFLLALLGGICGIVSLILQLF